MKTIVLTGAGISAESGIQTFRDSGGLWEGYSVGEVATPEGFATNPKKVNEFYDQRRAQLKTVEPNEAHKALARLEEHLQDDFLLITQNVDDLHERAGSKRLLHMHGELLKKICTHCGTISPCTDNLDSRDECQSCNQFGGLRPHVVWFSEEPFYMDEIRDAFEGVEMFISIGTSNNVYPASSFVGMAEVEGAHRVELTLEPSKNHEEFSVGIYGPATETLPKLVDRILMKDA